MKLTVLNKMLLVFIKARIKETLWNFRSTCVKWYECTIKTWKWGARCTCDMQNGGGEKKKHHPLFCLKGPLQPKLCTSKDLSGRDGRVRSGNCSWNVFCPCSYSSFLSSYFLIIYVFIFGCAGSSLLRGLLSRCAKWGPLSSCSAWASHCSGFSYCGEQALGCSGFRSCSAWAQ